MSLMLDEDEAFSLEGYSESDGYQRVALHGYLVERRSDGTYIAPLIPQLFRGYDGTQLQTWRQFIPAGSNVILSRSGGHPSVPRDELYWRKVEASEQEPPASSLAPQPSSVAPMALTDNPWIIVGITAGSILAIYLAAQAFRPKRRARHRH